MCAVVHRFVLTSACIWGMWRVVHRSAFKCCLQGPGLNPYIRAAGWGIVEGGGAGYQPHSRHFYKKNICQGQSALLLAASNGLEDVVIRLCEKNANPFITDRRGRGILEFVKKSQKENQSLLRWLQKRYPDLKETYVESRPEEKKQTDVWGQDWWRESNPYWKSWSSQEWKEWKGSSSSGHWWH